MGDSSDQPLSNMEVQAPGSAQFALANFIMKTHGPRASTVLAGSATPYLSIGDLISLSTDPDITRHVLTTDLYKKPLKLGGDQGSLPLREAIAATYSPSAGITPENVLAANGTTGANHIVYRTLLSRGDHVIIQYPIYGPCIEEPQAIGCSISYLGLDPNKNWSTNASDLENLIIPGKTKMIILNNPNNPTGTHLDTTTQRAIIETAKRHSLIIHADEIFRPLFHSITTETSPSLIEHPTLSYPNILVTSSMSKSYGLSGVRIGWITTRSPALYARLLNYRNFSVAALSFLDEAVATEALSPRCRPGILSKHLDLARTNLNALQTFVDKYPNQVEWSRPTCGAVAFIKIKDYHTGEPVDDVAFAEKLLDQKGLLISPGTLCFGFAQDRYGKAKEELQGRFRVHFTTRTETVENGLKQLAEVLDEEQTVSQAKDL